LEIGVAVNLVAFRQHPVEMTRKPNIKVNELPYDRRHRGTPQNWID
jgi:hypothetical protein